MYLVCTMKVSCAMFNQVYPSTMLLILKYEPTKVIRNTICVFHLRDRVLNLSDFIF